MNDKALVYCLSLSEDSICLHTRTVFHRCQKNVYKFPAFGWRLQLSDQSSSSPIKQAKSPAELGGGEGGYSHIV